jgi:hypothetical protein
MNITKHHSHPMILTYWALEANALLQKPANLWNFIVVAK